MLAKLILFFSIFLNVYANQTNEIILNKAIIQNNLQMDYYVLIFSYGILFALFLTAWFLYFFHKDKNYIIFGILILISSALAVNISGFLSNFFSKDFEVIILNLNLISLLFMIQYFLFSILNIINHKNNIFKILIGFNILLFFGFFKYEYMLNIINILFLINFFIVLLLIFYSNFKSIKINYTFFLSFLILFILSISSFLQINDFISKYLLFKYEIYALGIFVFILILFSLIYFNHLKYLENNFINKNLLKNIEKENKNKDNLILKLKEELNLLSDKILKLESSMTIFYKKIINGANIRFNEISKYLIILKNIISPMENILGNISGKLDQDKMRSCLDIIKWYINTNSNTTKTFMYYLENKEKIINLRKYIYFVIALSKDHIKNINMNVDIDKNVYIKANPLDLNQVFINLILNSVEAINEIKLNNGDITISVRQSENNVDIFFTDNGIGIVDLNKIFDLFYTTKLSHAGIGLFSVKKIILSYDGKIRVSSKPGRTTFNLILKRFNKYNLYNI